MSARPRVAFVVQRCGDDIAGGAEALCLATAGAMRDDWDCEILTTCARDASTWSDDYAPGPTQIGGIPARRFRVDRPRDRKRFDRMSATIARSPSTLAEQEAWMREQGPVASGLFAHLAEHGRSYDRVFFFSYLYATTYFGLPLVAERAVLVPLAHDEWMLQLGLFDRLFASAAHIGFVSEEERLLVEMRFPIEDRRSTPIRLAIERHAGNADAFRTGYGIAERFLLCVGRVETAKGTDELVSHFLTLRRSSDALPLLVLVGPVAMPLTDDACVRALGRISESDKWNALAAAEFVAVPSQFESLSIAALEAWAAGKAVLANGASAVLVGQCRRSGGGLWYANEREFVELAGSGLLGKANELGAQGARYVAATFTADAARASLRDAFAAGVRA
jgi:glycosyltransferase involved in cell wall biosynthesis